MGEGNLPLSFSTAQRRCIVIVNNGAVMRVKVKNMVMIQGHMLKPGETVMIPNNKAVDEYIKSGIAEVVKWRKRKVPDPPAKVGLKETTARKPVKEIASKTVVINVPKITVKEMASAKPGLTPKKKAAIPQKKRG